MSAASESIGEECSPPQDLLWPCKFILQIITYSFVIAALFVIIICLLGLLGLLLLLVLGLDLLG